MICFAAGIFTWLFSACIDFKLEHIFKEIINNFSIQGALPIRCRDDEIFWRSALLEEGLHRLEYLHAFDGRIVDGHRQTLSGFYSKISLPICFIHIWVIRLLWWKCQTHVQHYFYHGLKFFRWTLAVLIRIFKFQIAFHDLNPFPMKAIHTKRQFHLQKLNVCNLCSYK